MNRTDITFVIFTFNEQARIERAVRNFVKTGPVLVVDNHSTDDTEAIAIRAGARVLKHKNPGWVEDENTVAVVKGAVDTPWIYWAYADEMIDGLTLDALVSAAREDKYQIVRLTRKNYYYGAFCYEAYSSALNRLFRPSAIDFTGNEIHHFGRPTVPDSAIKHLDPQRHFVHHFISNTAKSYLRAIDGYTDVEAKRAGPKSVSRFILRALWTFTSNYLGRRGYKAGLPGFFLGLQMIYYDALLNMKSFEAQTSLNAARIEEKNNKVRDQLLTSLT